MKCWPLGDWSAPDLETTGLSHGPVVSILHAHLSVKKQDVCHVCSQLTKNAILWQLRRSPFSCLTANRMSFVQFRNLRRNTTPENKQQSKQCVFPSEVVSKKAKEVGFVSQQSHWVSFWGARISIHISYPQRIRTKAKQRARSRPCSAKNLAKISVLFSAETVQRTLCRRRQLPAVCGCATNSRL